MPDATSGEESMDRGGATLAYYRAGEGIPLVLLHGFPLDRAMWLPQAESLRTTCEVLVPDLRGFGASTLEAGDVDHGVAMELFADDVTAILDAIGMNQPVVLAGFSMGGYVAWQFALRYPERLRALVLCDTRAVADDENARSGRLAMAEKTLAAGDASPALGMLPKLLGRVALESSTDLVNQVRAMISRQSAAAIVAAQRGMAMRPDVRERLGQIDKPALAIVGAEDVISTPAEMREIAAAMSACEFVEIEGAGHLSPLEQPEAVSSAIAKFVARLE